MSLEDAIGKARAELEELKAREASLLDSSGMKSLIATLTEENQRLNAERTATRERIEQLKAAIAEAKERRAEVELELKGARARVLKLGAAVRKR